MKPSTFNCRTHVFGIKTLLVWNHVNMLGEYCLQIPRLDEICYEEGPSWCEVGDQLRHIQDRCKTAATEYQNYRAFTMASRAIPSKILSFS